MVVFAIVGTLASIFIPVYQKYKENNKSEYLTTDFQSERSSSDFKESSSIFSSKDNEEIIEFIFSKGYCLCRKGDIE